MGYHDITRWNLFFNCLKLLNDGLFLAMNIKLFNVIIVNVFGTNFFLYMYLKVKKERCIVLPMVFTII